MAEPLVSLCDKLTIVKLKQWHFENAEKPKSLAIQQAQLQEEINGFVQSAYTGKFQVERLIFASNKVFKKEGNVVADVKGNIGEVFSWFAVVNCRLWHKQEEVYEFEKDAVEEKDKVMKQLAPLNLERNKCIDGIDPDISIND